MKTVLTIAGSDCSGGAGIQADIKTITAHKLYAMSAVTALTAQNTMGVFGVLESTPEFLALQLDCIFTDIRPDAIKIGMVSNQELIQIIAKKIEQVQAKNVVVDPVMISTSGCKLLSEDAVDIIVNTLFPLASVITPNIPEAQVLCGFQIKGHKDMITAAKSIQQQCNHDTNILIKGGHLAHSADDLLYSEGKAHWFTSKRVDNPNTHGTGCSLSSAIACNLAEGYGAEDSVKRAKDYVKGAIADYLNLGNGNGPLNHMYNLRICDTIK